ncbi:MAG: GNAT family N-acetyltransferase, partial [Rhodothermales bacterium]
DVVTEAYDGLPGVLGPREEARYFSRIWCGPRALSFRPAMDQRIYKLDQLTEPDPWPDGIMRPALEVDKPLILDWLRRFFEETHMPVSNAQDVTDRLVPEGSMFLWDVGGTAVSMAGVTGRTPNGVRIGFVYTPVEERQKGYGTAITAALTKSVLDQGKKFCFLFTDASNPTSNSIYRALGYHPVADVVDYQFF